MKTKQTKVKLDPKLSGSGENGAVDRRQSFQVKIEVLLKSRDLEEATRMATKKAQDLTKTWGVFATSIGRVSEYKNGHQ